MKEKRLDARLWRYKGAHQKGSHFPICVFTNNVGRRSPKKLEERKEKQKQRPWYVPKRSQSSQERWQERWQPRPEERPGLQADADPQQGWQPRQEGRPAVAGAHTPDSFDRWKERCGRRRDKQPTISDKWSGDTHALGWDTWAAAVAASTPMKVGTYDARCEMPMKVGTARLWSDDEPQCPASALREVVKVSLLD